MIQRTLLLIIALGIAEVAHAQEYKVSDFRYNHVQDPQEFGDVINEIGNSPVARSAVNAAAQAYGIPSAAVSAFFFAADSVWEKQGEEIRSDLRPPQGYSACRVDIVKRNSQNGPGAINAKVFKKKVNIYSWVRANNATQGRNWVDYRLRILYVRDDVYPQHNCISNGEYAFDIRF